MFIELAVHLQAGLLLSINFQQFPIKWFQDDSHKQQQPILLINIFNQIVQNYYHFEAEEKLQESHPYLFGLQKLVK